MASDLHWSTITLTPDDAEMKLYQSSEKTSDSTKNWYAASNTYPTNFMTYSNIDTRTFNKTQGNLFLTVSIVASVVQLPLK